MKFTCPENGSLQSLWGQYQGSKGNGGQSQEGRPWPKCNRLRHYTLMTFQALMALSVRNLVHHITDETLEGLVLDELLVDLGVVFQ